MLLKDNFSEIQMFMEQPVTFYSDNELLAVTIDIKMRLPTIAQLYTDPYMQSAIAYFNIDTPTLATITSLPSIWALFHSMWSKPAYPIYRIFQYFFEYAFGDQLIIDIDGLDWNISGYHLDEELFNRIGEIVLIAAGIRKFSDQSSKIKKPQWLIDKEKEIARIKSKASPVQTNQTEELLKVLMPLNYELNYSFEQLAQMNYYHIHMLASYIPRIVNYDVSKRNIFSKKKLKYITDK